MATAVTENDNDCETNNHDDANMTAQKWQYRG
jgi:hypothetical protein